MVTLLEQTNYIKYLLRLDVQELMTLIAESTAGNYRLACLLFHCHLHGWIRFAMRLLVASHAICNAIMISERLVDNYKLNSPREITSLISLQPSSHHRSFNH